MFAFMSSRHSPANVDCIFRTQISSELSFDQGRYSRILESEVERRPVHMMNFVRNSGSYDSTN